MLSLHVIRHDRKQCPLAELSGTVRIPFLRESSSRDTIAALVHPAFGLLLKAHIVSSQSLDSKLHKPPSSPPSLHQWQIIQSLILDQKENNEIFFLSTLLVAGRHQ